jgi:hypothetical protein
VNLPKVEVRNAGHSETLRNSVVGLPNKHLRARSRRFTLNGWAPRLEAGGRTGGKKDWYQERSQSS